jgi:hypothetical protein
MKKTAYTFEQLMKLSKTKLQDRSKDLEITFQDNDTKAMLSNAILAKQAQKELADEESNSGSGSSSEGKTLIKDGFEDVKKDNVAYDLKPKCKGVVVLGLGTITRETALEDQELLAKLFKKGNRAVIIKKD